MTKSVRIVGCSLVAMLVFSLTYTVVRAAEGDTAAKPKHAVKEVMKGAHQAPEGSKTLLAKVLEGSASAEEKQQLLDLYISLAENKPPKGELADWQKKTGAVVISAAKIVVGRDGAIEELKVATNCGACHKDHKPPQK